MSIAILYIHRYCPSALLVLSLIRGLIWHVNQSSIRLSIYFSLIVKLWKHAWICSWNQPVLSNEGKRWKIKLHTTKVCPAVFTVLLYTLNTGQINSEQTFTFVKHNSISVCLLTNLLIVHIILLNDGHSVDYWLVRVHFKTLWF